MHGNPNWCDNFGNNYINFSPSSFEGNGSLQKVVITFAQYQCGTCNQILFTKSSGESVNLIKDADSGEFLVTGTQRNPSPVTSLSIDGNILAFNGIDCGWDVGSVSITVYLMYENETNTLYYSSNPIKSRSSGSQEDKIKTLYSDDLILGEGAKQFIFHTQMQYPNNPPVLYIAPKKNGSTEFDWEKQITIKDDGHVGISCDPGEATFKIYNTTLPNFVLQGATSQLQIGLSISNGSFAPYAQQGDIVYRALGIRHGLIFNMANNDADGQSYIKFGDDGNGGWFSIFNDKTVRIDGNMFVKEINVRANVWSDHVFSNNYKLKTIGEVEEFIKNNNHLPDVPSEQDVLEKGINLAEMNAILLQKIEETMLYVIDLKKENDELRTRLEALEK